MKNILLYTLAFCFAQTTFAQTIDSKTSKVKFEVSNMGKTVEGILLNLSGTINFDAENLEASSFEATVDPSTINTKSKGRDKHLQKDDFFGDISAGLTVGIMLIPQGMAYAMLAGLPPIYGLYTATIPLILYAIFGTSKP